MSTEDPTFDQWLHKAKVSRERLNDEQLAVLKSAFQFLEQSDRDYASVRIAGHFLLHCGLGFQISQVARLVGISPRSVSRHRTLSSREVVQQIQHRLSGRPHGKLLPRHTGPIAEFLFTHPDATRDNLLDFIGQTWDFRVSKVALWEFLKKFGLDRASLDEARQARSKEEQQSLSIAFEEPWMGGLVPAVPDNFFLPTRSTPELSCCGPKS
jgi:transposase